MQVSGRPILLAGALAIALSGLAGLPVRAEVRELVVIYDMQLCPMIEPVLETPPGWDVDLEPSCDSRLKVFVPRGKRFGEGPAAIYARATKNTDKISLDDFIRNSQARWRASVKDSQITPAGEITRANGQPSIRLFRYRNPSRPGQEFEYGAFTLDTDRAGSEYRVMIMLTAPSEQNLKKAEPLYRAMLEKY